MSPRLFLQRVVEPGLALLPGYMVSAQARVALMAIAGQESNWAARAQTNGPARGYWQFEPAGADAVLKTQALLALAVLATLDIPASQVMPAIQYNDAVACVFARLLLWGDPAALPAIGDASGCWGYYTRNWRPGKPDETRWGPAYSMACSTVASNAAG